MLTLADSDTNGIFGWIIMDQTLLVATRKRVDIE